MRVLIDMNLTPRWVGYLIEAGHEAVHWSAAGPMRAKDSDICDYSRRHGYVLLTNDLDFPHILPHTREAGPSVILLRGEPLVPESRGALLRAMQVCEEEISRGPIVTLDWSDRPRARVLPLR